MLAGAESLLQDRERVWDGDVKINSTLKFDLNSQSILLVQTSEVNFTKTVNSLCATFELKSTRTVKPLGISSVVNDSKTDITVYVRIYLGE